MKKGPAGGPDIIEGRYSVVQRGSTIAPLTEASSPSAAQKPRKARAPRHDGWTEARRKIFLAVLRETCCVRDACRVAGISTTSAYRLRERDPAMAGQWDEAVDNAQRGLVAVAHQHAVVGKETVIYRGGVEVERRVAPSDSIMALLIRRGDLGGRIGARTADKVITWEEWQAGVRFDDRGNKIDQREEAEMVRKTLDAKLGDMRMKLLARRAKAEERVRAAEARAAEIERENGGG